MDVVVVIAVVIIVVVYVMVVAAVVLNLSGAVFEVILFWSLFMALLGYLHLSKAFLCVSLHYVVAVHWCKQLWPYV